MRAEPGYTARVMFGTSNLDDETIRVAVRGSPEALTRICHELRPQVQVMVAARLNPNPAQLDYADDITQDALLAVTEGISRLENQSVLGLKVYLSGIVTHKVVDWIRKHAKRNRPPVKSLDSTITAISRAGPLWQFLSTSGASPRTLAEREDLTQRVLAGLQELRPDESELIALAVFDQLPTREIARIKSITREAAAMRIKRALEALRRNVMGSTKVGVANGPGN